MSDERYELQCDREDDKAVYRFPEGLSLRNGDSFTFAPNMRSVTVRRAPVPSPDSGRRDVLEEFRDACVAFGRTAGLRQYDTMARLAIQLRAALAASAPVAPPEPDSFVEDHIRRVLFSASSGPLLNANSTLTDDERTLIAGNLRHYDALLREHLAAPPAGGTREATTMTVEINHDSKAPFAPRTYQSAWIHDRLVTAEEWLNAEADAHADSEARLNSIVPDDGPSTAGNLRAIAAEVAQLRAELRQWADEYTRRAALAAPGAGTTERERELYDLAALMLSTFVHPGYPGESCHQSGWIPDRQLAEWRERLNRVTRPTGAPEEEQ